MLDIDVYMRDQSRRIEIEYECFGKLGRLAVDVEDLTQSHQTGPSLEFFDSSHTEVVVLESRNYPGKVRDVLVATRDRVEVRTHPRDVFGQAIR